MRTTCSSGLKTLTPVTAVRPPGGRVPAAQLTTSLPATGAGLPVMTAWVCHGARHSPHLESWW